LKKGKKPGKKRREWQKGRKRVRKKARKRATVNNPTGVMVEWDLKGGICRAAETIRYRLGVAVLAPAHTTVEDDVGGDIPVISPEHLHRIRL
jgi:hypothetical protein